MHLELVCINNHTPHQALSGRQPHLLPPLEGGYYGDLDVKGQNDLARVREIVAIYTIEAIVKQRFARGDKRQHVVALQRAQYLPGDLVDIWYDPPNEDTFGWRGPAQIASIQGNEGNVIARFQGEF